MNYPGKRPCRLRTSRISNHGANEHGRKRAGCRVRLGQTELSSFATGMVELASILDASKARRGPRRSATSPRRQVLPNDRTPRLTGAAPAPPRCKKGRKKLAPRPDATRSHTTAARRQDGLTHRLAPTLPATQPVGRKLIVGVELRAPDHAAWIRGKCNRHLHKRAVCAPSHNCALGTLSTWQAGGGTRKMMLRNNREVTL
jgi:hypothetical protein